MTEDGDQIIYEGRIAGVAYGHYKFRPDRLKGRDLVLVAMPENEYDAKAVAIKVVNGTLEHHVGYIPRGCTSFIHEAWAAGSRLSAKCHRVDLEDHQAYVLVTEHVPRIVAARRRLTKRGLLPVGTRRLILT